VVGTSPIVLVHLANVLVALAQRLRPRSLLEPTRQLASVVAMKRTAPARLQNVPAAAVPSRFLSRGVS